MPAQKAYKLCVEPKTRKEKNNNNNNNQTNKNHHTDRRCRVMLAAPRQRWGRMDSLYTIHQ